MIIGVGVDLVSVERMRIACIRTKRLVKKLFTQSEVEYCYRRKDPFEHLSARFAAKEAAFKAIGTGWSQGVRWTDVEVVVGRSGAPTLNLHGAFKNVCIQKGVRTALVSLSHMEDYAIAIVVLAG